MERSADADRLAEKRAAVERLLRRRQNPQAAPVTISPAPRERFEPFPLTETQEAYWLGQTEWFELGGVAAHMYYEVDARDLDLPRWERALRRLIEHHDMLRAVINPDGTQNILPQVPAYEISVFDGRGLPAEELERRLASVRDAMSHQVRRGDEWPLFEVRASLISDRTTRAHISFNLLMIDAHSIGLLLTQWHSLYEQPGLALPSPGLSFRDYVLAERAQRGTPEWSRSREYWMGRAPHLPTAPRLPLAKTSVPRARFKRLQRQLTADRWRRLKQGMSAAGLTHSGGLLTAFGQVLSYWSEDPHFTLNLTLFNRRPWHRDVPELIGDFTTLCLLEADFREPLALGQSALKLQQQLWRDLDHRAFNGVSVLREVMRARNLPPSAVAPVVFTSLLGSGPLPNGLFPIGEIVYGISQTPQVWLDHQVFEQGDELIYNWDFVPELFPPGLMEEMFAAYGALLDRLGDEPDAWQRPAGSLLPPGQSARRRMVNETRREYRPECLHEGFVRRAEGQPHAIAIDGQQGRITYGELYEQTSRLARALRERGVSPGRPVAVLLDSYVRQITAALAISEAGGAYVPVDLRWPEYRRREVLLRSGVEHALTSSGAAPESDWPEGIDRLEVDGPDVERQPAGRLQPTARPDDLAYIIFTSGSTGVPKGVAVEHRAAFNTIADMLRRFGVSQDDRVFAVSSFGFDLSVYDIFGTLASGGTMVLPGCGATPDTQDWYERMMAGGVTLWNSVPALLEMLVTFLESHPDLPKPPLRQCWLSGDWIPVSLPDRVRDLFPGVSVISLGGATEAAIWSIFHPVTEVEPGAKSIPYGRPLANQRWHVLNAQMQPCPDWVPGDLYISGDGLAREYWKEPDKTRASFFEHPAVGERVYRTGDRGRYLPGGDIEFLGRTDTQVKVLGHRIELGEIEAALYKHYAVREAAAQAFGPPARKRLGAFVTLNSPGAATGRELREFLSGRLPDYMVPARVEVLDSFPLTANGKVDRSAFPDPFAQASTAGAVDAAQGETLARLTAMAARELQLQPSLLNPHQNLFELGVNSIDMVRLVGQFENEFGFRPSFREFFQDPTIGALARAYEQHAGKEQAPAPPARNATALILDPQAREAFRREGRGIRPLSEGGGRLPLKRESSDSGPTEYFTRRRAVRKFLPRPVPPAALGEWLAGLRCVMKGDAPKYAYGSAGGLYPVQTYLHLKDDGVSGCPGGVFYYHPVEHCLAPITLGAEIERTIHEPYGNRPAFDSARFSLFFISQPRAIEPMYGEESWRFSLLEAGAMSHVLECSAWRYGLGVCPIGWLDFRSIRGIFQLEERQELLYSLVGGLAEEFAEQAEWEEGIV